MSNAEQTIFANQLSKLKRKLNQVFLFNWAEKLVTGVFFVVNYPILYESYAHMLKKSVLNKLNDLLVSWSHDIPSANLRITIKYSVSTNYNHIYLAVLGTSLKDIKTRDRIMKKQKIYERQVNDSKNTKKDKFSLYLENQQKMKPEESLLKIREKKQKNTRINFEEQFPIEFLVFGNFQFLNPAKMNFADPRFIVFIQKLKRIVLPILSKVQSNPS